ncbi:MAG: PQQ-binding-like beta-propeller repeat protein, partial [Candidatus Binatia bacterium]
HDAGACVLAAVEPATGEVRWSQRLPAFQMAPMSVAAGVVFMGLADGKLRAWRATDGEPLWESAAYSPIAGGPAIVAGHVLVGTGAGMFLPGRKLLAFALKAAS